MSYQFDATLKDILGDSVGDLTPVLHLPGHLPAVALNVDLSTVSAATDLAFGFGEPLQEIDDINFQSGPDPQLDARLLLYNAAYRHRYSVTVRSLLILLRPTADHPRLTGQLAYQSGGSRVEFVYEVIRMWQQPLAPFLTGGLALLPLAPLCQLPSDVAIEQALQGVIHQIDERLAREVPYARAVKLMTATFVLTGLRVARHALTEVFRGVKIMHESSAFALYEEKGREEGRQEGLVEASHRLLLRLGGRRFGAADAATEVAVRAIRDLDRLERMADAVLTVTSWVELLATV